MSVGRQGEGRVWSTHSAEQRELQIACYAHFESSNLSLSHLLHAVHCVTMAAEVHSDGHSYTKQQFTAGRK